MLSMNDKSSSSTAVVVIGVVLALLVVPCLLGLVFLGGGLLFEVLPI